MKSIRSMVSTHRMVVLAIGLAGLILGGLGIFYARADDEKTGVAMTPQPTRQVTIPLIDAEVPTKVATASFALG
jgi:hypothetical protein